MIRKLPKIQALVVAGLVVSGCAKRTQGDATPPDEGDSAASAGSSSRATRSDCSPGGASVSVNVSRESGGRNLAGDELGALLGWIGGFVQPCLDAPSQAHHFTLVFELGAEGEVPTYELIEREALPGLAACLDEGFASAPPPPLHSMRVSIAVPWGCPTLGADFTGESAVDDPAPGAEGAEGASGAAEPEAGAAKPGPKS